MHPDYSPAMLRLFCEAARWRLAQTARPLTRAKAEAHLARLSGAPALSVRLAFDGRLKRAATRARLWAALGHFPADHGVTLRDDGGQDRMGRPRADTTEKRHANCPDL